MSSSLRRFPVLVGDLSRDQTTDHVVLRVLPALHHQAVVVHTRVDVGLHVVVVQLDLARLAMQASVDPVPDLLAEVLGHAGHPGDDLDGERAGEVLHDVEVVRIRLAEVVLDELDDGLALRLDGPRRERLVEQAAHVPVIRGIHEDDRFLRHLTAAHHAEVAPTGRRERLVILERHGHVFVAGQRVEVLFLVVIDRSLVAHPPINFVGVVEVLLRIRAELQFWLRHGLLFRGGLPTASVTRD